LPPTGFWTSLGGLSAPALAIVVCAIFVWALATGRLVLGSQYRAEKARADRYDEANRDLTAEFIKMSATQNATASILASLRSSIADAKEGE
jgi:hypothetical protein